MPWTTAGRQPPKQWKDLYQAALLEPDVAKLADRIADAEEALVLRSRELFQSSEDHFQEEKAMAQAVYALHALRIAYQLARTKPKAA
jgi:hypothetical protein